MAQWTEIQGLKEYGRVLLRKMGFVALGWVLMYFISQPFRQQGGVINVLVLFSPMVGALAGLVVGWYLATEAVEDSGMTGMVLWTILVVASWVPMWLVEAVMHWIFPGWTFGFGGWMLMTSAMLLSLASAVWHASTQE